MARRWRDGSAAAPKGRSARSGRRAVDVVWDRVWLVSGPRLCAALGVPEFAGRTAAYPRAGKWTIMNMNQIVLDDRLKRKLAAMRAERDVRRKAEAEMVYLDALLDAQDEVERGKNFQGRIDPRYQTHRQLYFRWLQVPASPEHQRAHRNRLLEAGNGLKARRAPAMQLH